MLTVPGELSHGRETAANVDRRYSQAEINDRLTRIQQAWLYLISCMQNYVLTPSICSVDATLVRAKLL